MCILVISYSVEIIPDPSPSGPGFMLSGELGVRRYGDEAPMGTTTAWVAYRGRERRVAVKHGHFPFVAWNTGFKELPSLARLE
jgi:hypothetical protein